MNEEYSEWEEDINTIRRRFKQNIELRAPPLIIAELVRSVRELHHELDELGSKYIRDAIKILEENS